MMHAVLDSRYTDGPIKACVTYGNIGADPTHTRLKVQTATLSATLRHSDETAGEPIELGQIEFRPTLTGQYQMMTVPFPMNQLGDQLGDKSFVIELSLLASPVPLDPDERHRSSTRMQK